MRLWMGAGRESFANLLNRTLAHDFGISEQHRHMVDCPTPTNMAVDCHFLSFLPLWDRVGFS